MITLEAILLNLLSVAVAYGVLVAVFQWGFGRVHVELPEQRGHCLLAAAVLVRGGDHNWYLPSWLDRLPRVSHGAELPSAIGDRPPIAVHPAPQPPVTPPPDKEPLPVCSEETVSAMNEVIR